MINAINTEYGAIKLVPDEIAQQPDLKLFASDSMSLIIGPNGSGKSRTLSSIVSNILNINKDVVGADNPYSKTLIIYYTPVPYTVDMPEENQQFINLQSMRRMRENKNSDYPMLRSLVKNFNISPEISINFHFSESIIFEISMLFILGNVIDKDALPDPLRSAIAQQDVVKKAAEKFRRDSGLDYLDYVKTKEYDAISLAQELLNEKIKAYIYEKLEATPSLKLLALQRTIRAHKKQTDIIQSVLQAEGVPFRRKMGTAPRTAMKTYRRMVAELEGVRKILGLGDLPEKPYIMEESSTEALNELKQHATIGIAKLSAGGNALINQFSKIEAALRQRKSKTGEFDNLLLLIDEGDIFLHLSWQQKYVDYLNNYIKTVREKKIFRTIQVILTTHSPVLMSDFPRDSIIKLKTDAIGIDRVQQNVDESGVAKGETIVSFGAPLQDIINRSGGAGTMGEFAAKFIGGLVQKIKKGERPARYHIDLIDDPVIRSYIRNRSN